MGLSKTFSVALLSLMAMAIMFHISHAQNTPRDYLNPHNAARDQVGVSHMTWDASLANYAQNYVNSLAGSCNLVHSNGPYGENLAKAFPNLDAAGAVRMWVNEKSSYDYGSNTCSGVCGHYTQVVWRRSVRVGCGRTRCNNGWWIISCNYSPAGNINGQRPY